MNDATDQMLLAQIRAGDRAAFGRLVDRHYDYVYRIAFRWCRNRSDAEDITQEVAIKLARTVSSYEGRSAFTSWLYRLTLNCVRDFQRSLGRHQGKLTAFAEHQAVMGDLSTRLDPSDGGGPDDPGARLWQAVGALPDKQRDAMMLVYAEEMSHAAAAEIMGCKETTVSWHIHKAKKKLKDRLAETHTDADTMLPPHTPSTEPAK